MKGGTSTSSSSSKSSVTGTARLGFHPAVAGCQLGAVGVAAAVLGPAVGTDVGPDGGPGVGRETLPAWPLATVRVATG
ncbi:MAG TPA: hypothetical protein VJ757_01120, partial [Pseudonocardiaceae bacterium]|nr:hypothetical protein [Pseudonocardiaceae bacterium]